MSPTLTLALDLLMVILLVATIVYAIILNRQIVRLRESRGEMIELVKGLNEAMTKAEASVRGLKRTAGETGESLQRTIDKAAGLRDELQFMIEAANTLADRLSGQTDAARAAARTGSDSGLGERSLSDRGLGERGLGERGLGDRAGGNSLGSPRSVRPSSGGLGGSGLGGGGNTGGTGSGGLGGSSLGGGPRPAAMAALRPLLDEESHDDDALPPLVRRSATESGYGGGERVREGEENLSRAERELLRAIENRR